MAIETFNIPSRSLSFISTLSFKNLYDFELRKKINISIKTNSKFKSFLFEEIKHFIPKSYLENYQDCLNFFKMYLKKKRLFIGSTLIEINDCYKIFLAKSKLKKSKYIYIHHGAGIHSSKDLLFNHFYKISDKMTIQSKKINKLKKNFYLGIDIFEPKKNLKIKEKILINLYDLAKYHWRMPLNNELFSNQVRDFKKFVLSLKKLNIHIKKKIKFRVKGFFGFGTEKRLLKIFGEHTIEKQSLVKYSVSIEESKLVICFIPQTSYFESLHKNIPTILVGGTSYYFDTKQRTLLLKKLQLNNMYFENMTDAVKFINKNENIILSWWQNKSIQILRNLLLEKYYKVSTKGYENFKKFLKNEISLLN